MAAAARNPHDLGASVHFPEKYKNMWLEWYDNRDNLVFDRSEGRLVVKAGPKSLVTYAPFMDLAVKDGEMVSKCTIRSCESPASKEGIRLTYASKVNTANFIDHIWRSYDGSG